MDDRMGTRTSGLRSPIVTAPDSGTRFFSPNCSWRVEVPPLSQENPFAPGSAQPSLETFQRPRWWTKQFGWAAFVPRWNPGFEPPFNILFPLPWPRKGRHGRFSIRKHTVERWNALEVDIKTAITLLTDNYRIACVFPFLPLAVGYGRMHDSSEAAIKSVYDSRMWFTVWQGLLSFVIAQATSKTRLAWNIGVDSTLPPFLHWMAFLEGKGYTQHWLSSIAQSSVCDFSVDGFRAGVFLDPSRTDEWQPSVEWFIEHRIPVWYPLSAESLAMVPSRYHPPQELMADAFPISMSIDLSLPPHFPTSAYHPFAIAARRQQIQDFITSREPRIARAKALASPEERRLWATAEKELPTSRCKVIRWEPCSTDPLRLVPARTPSCEVDAILAEYPPPQRWYDPVLNEWHCARELSWEAVIDGGEELGVDALGGNYDGLPPQSNDDGAITQSLSSECPSTTMGQQPSRSAAPASCRDRDDHEAFCMHHLLHLDNANQRDEGAMDDSTLLREYILETMASFYGYIHPVPPETHDVAQAPLTVVQLASLLRYVGLCPDLADCPALQTSPANRLALEFFQSLIEGSSVSGNPALDTASKHFEQWKYNHHLKYCHLVQINAGSSLYCFALPSCAWVLGITTATDALVVCRWSALNPEDLVLKLIRNGIRFYTFHRIPTAPALSRMDTLAVTPLPLRSLPVRLPGYVFTVQDYLDYCDARDAWLAKPRMRAALARGGIIWRLARSLVSPDDVLVGPTSGMDTPKLSIVHPLAPGEMLSDDDLTPLDLQLLCGAYICYTGHGSQTSLRSWWPLPELFESESCGENYGRWNAYREAHYLRRHREALSGKAEPLGVKEWRQRMHGNSATRKIRANVERASRSLLDQLANTTLRLNNT